MPCRPITGNSSVPRRRGGRPCPPWVSLRIRHRRNGLPRRFAPRNDTTRGPALFRERGPLRAAGPTALALPLGELSAQPTERARRGVGSAPLEPAEVDAGRRGRRPLQTATENSPVPCRAGPMCPATDCRKSSCRVIAKPVRRLVAAIRSPCPGPLRAAGPHTLALPLGELSAQPTERACRGVGSAPLEPAEVDAGRRGLYGPVR